MNPIHILFPNKEKSSSNPCHVTSHVITFIVFFSSLYIDNMDRIDELLLSIDLNQPIVIQGDIGIGKTTLLRHVSQVKQSSK